MCLGVDFLVVIVYTMFRGELGVVVNTPHHAGEVGSTPVSSAIHMPR